MKEIRALLKNNLEVKRSSATKLRKTHVGSIIQTDVLEKLDYESTDESEHGCRFEKIIEGEDRKIILDIADDGTLCRILLSFFADLQKIEGVTSPCGWYVFDQCLDDAACSQISNELLDASKRVPSADPTEEFQWLLNRAGHSRSSEASVNELAYHLCCGAFHYYEEAKDNLSANLFAISIHRHLGQLSHPYVLGDMPFITGRLRLLGECVYSIAKVCDLDFDITPEVLCNIGAVLCDNLNSPELALECFKQVMKMKPSLQPPKQCIWVAGHKMSEEALSSSNYDKVISLFNEISSLSNIGNMSMSEHGFLTFLGFAYEARNDIEKARMFYTQSLEVDPNCSASQDALNRLNSKGASSVKLEEQISNLRRQSEYSSLRSIDGVEYGI